MHKSKKRRLKMRGRSRRSRSKKKGGLNLLTSYAEQQIKKQCAEQHKYDPTKMKWQNVKSIGPKNVEAYEDCKKDQWYQYLKKEGREQEMDASMVAEAEERLEKTKEEMNDHKEITELARHFKMRGFTCKQLKGAGFGLMPLKDELGAECSYEELRKLGFLY